MADTKKKTSRKAESEPTWQVGSTGLYALRTGPTHRVGEQRPFIVVRVNDDETLNIVVFTDGENDTGRSNQREHTHLLRNVPTRDLEAE